jgi:signal peptidase I
LVQPDGWPHSDGLAQPDGWPHSDGLAQPDGLPVPDAWSRSDGWPHSDGLAQPDGLPVPDAWSRSDGFTRADGWARSDRLTRSDGVTEGLGSLFDPNGQLPPGGAATMPTAPSAQDDAPPTARPGAPDRPDTKRGSRHKAGRHRARRSWWVELPVLLVFALILALLIKSFVVQAFFIPSSSMEPTLDIGDKVLVSKITYDFRSIQRGDVIVFNGDGSWDSTPAPSQSLFTRAWDSVVGLFGTAPGVHDFIKRVIGIPGDHVACCNAQHQITVNSVPLNESSVPGGYLFSHNEPSMTSFSITVPEGRLWVMGDHRDVSADSRYHMNDPGHGTIPESHVVGRAFMIIAPFSRWRILPIPSNFQQPKLVSGAAAALLGKLPAPTAPLALGFLGALPLTWLQRRLRRWLMSLLRRWLGRGKGGRPRGRRSPLGG